MVFNDKSTNSHEPMVGTGTTGPGEAVFVIKIVKLEGVECKTLDFRFLKQLKK